MISAAIALFAVVSVWPSAWCADAESALTPSEQLTIPRVEQMPNIPTPFKMRDWKSTARNFDRLAFDFDVKGEHLPLIWHDDERVNFDMPGFGLPSYVGDPRWGKSHEALTCLGAVLGASLVGIDKSDQDGHDFVNMCKQYFNRANGENVILNNTRQGSAGSFWYRLWPAMAYCMLLDNYREKAGMQELMRTMADRWQVAAIALQGDFNHTGFDLKRREAVDNGRWKEPDGAAGIAWLQYMAWSRWKDEKHLDAAKVCMQYLDNRDSEDGPYYEVLMPYGAYLAARMNAELGLDYDLHKMINWCFDGTSPCRKGWGVMAESWGDYDCYGLVGQTRTGYAFAMNTFAQVGALVPLVRYDPRYARAIGKWVLNAANASRLFYADAHPSGRQTSAHWKGDPDHAIAYEGLRRDLKGGKFEFFTDKLSPRGPYAVGDQIKQQKSKTDFCLYGGAYVGMFGGIISTTNEEKILQLDCLKTDFFHDRAYPTYLYFNPHDGPKEVEIKVGENPVDLYDTVSKTFIRRNVTGRSSFRLDAESAAVVVLTPANGKVTQAGHKKLVNGVVVDYRAYK